MEPISRRSCLKTIGLVAAANSIPCFAPHLLLAEETAAQPKATASELTSITGIAQAFLDKYKCPGLSVAIARHGQMVFAEGFGVTDKETGERVTPAHLFRICSVTKPMTSAAIYLLIEQGKLKLDDLVFGPQGVLGKDFQTRGLAFVEDITIRHLLTHTVGGWSNSKNDPMFADPKLNHHELIAWTLKSCPLESLVGARFAYSNFGYCLLGRVIEKISGKSYEEFMRENIFARCGITDMRLAGNTLSDRVKGEVVYYDQTGEAPYGMNVRRMDSHGGWLGTPSDAVKFAMHVDGFDYTPNILDKKTIATMTAPTPASPGYASGWFVNSGPNRWHPGNLPGAVSFLVRTGRGLCWAAFANTRVVGGVDLDDLMWKIAKAVPAWNA
jgi:CubicO group peptidase (beta-lactamase class C family)